MAFRDDPSIPDVPIEKLDYDYIKKCKDPGELQDIVIVLQSGKEGYYPDLLKKNEVLSEINNWIRFIKKEDTQLLNYSAVRQPLPPIRNTGKEKQPFNVEEALEKSRRLIEEGDKLKASLLLQKILSRDSVNPVATKLVESISSEIPKLSPETPLIQELN